jgi:hypothetical protein
MIIRCTKCKSKFEQGASNNRICGSEDCRMISKSGRQTRHYHFWTYIAGIQKYFQNPIYQYIRLTDGEPLNSSIQYGVQVIDGKEAIPI